MKKLYNNKVLETFILLQPIIDMITGIMIYKFDISLTLGMIIRFIFLIYCSVYIISKKNKKVLLYIGIWILYMIINIVGNYIIKDSFNIISHAKDLIHMIYLPIILLFFYLYLKEHKNFNRKIFTYMGIIVGISFIISILTNTTHYTYRLFSDATSRGYLGWFKSGNEYGIILTSLLGLNLINYIKDKKISNMLSVSLLTLFLCLLGTKTSYMGLIILLAFFVVYELIKTIKNKTIKANGKYIAFVFILLLMSTVTIKKLPIYYNLVGMYENVVEEVKQEENVEEEPSLTSILFKKKAASTLVYNGRDDYIVLNKEIYNNAPIFNKLFGITKQGNYINGELFNHINERDFHDLYMYYGIVGLLLELLLPLSIIISILKNIFKNFKKNIAKEEVVFASLIIALNVLVSYMAGHLVFQPAVVIYFAIILNSLLKVTRSKA